MSEKFEGGMPPQEHEETNEARHIELGQVSRIFNEKVATYLSGAGIDINGPLSEETMSEVRKIAFPYNASFAIHGPRGNPEDVGYFGGCFPPEQYQISGEIMAKHLKDRVFLSAVRNYGIDYHPDFDPIVDQESGRKTSDLHHRSSDPWFYKGVYNNELTQILSNNEAPPEGYHWSVSYHDSIDKKNIEEFLLKATNEYLTGALPEDIMQKLKGNK